MCEGKCAIYKSGLGSNLDKSRGSTVAGHHWAPPASRNWQKRATHSLTHSLGAKVGALSDTWSIDLGIISRLSKLNSIGNLGQIFTPPAIRCNSHSMLNIQTYTSHRCPLKEYSKRLCSKKSNRELIHQLCAKVAGVLSDRGRAGACIWSALNITLEPWNKNVNFSAINRSLINT